MPDFNPHERIAHLRNSITSFVNKQIFDSTISGKVLEIGPQVQQNVPSEYFLNIKNTLVSRGVDYTSVDSNSKVGADVVSDILNLRRKFKKGTFDSIIALEVLEHVSEFWKVPRILHELLKPDGYIFITTPFYFLWHDPRPDYWRLSRDGLNFIFNPYFDIEIEAYFIGNDDGRTPLGHSLVGKVK